MHDQVRDIVRAPLSLLTRLRLILFGHEDLAGIIFWAALIGICGALCSVAFREGARLLELLFTRQSQSLVQAAANLAWWHRALVPVIGGVLAGLVLATAWSAPSCAVSSPVSRCWPCSARRYWRRPRP
jgi:CIC family chloride channel protein